MIHHIKLDFNIQIKSKWHTGSGEGNLVLDRLTKRDARNRPFIPGSTLKGVIRESCEKISRTLKFPEPSDPHQTDLKIQDSFKALKELKSPVDRLFGNKFEGGHIFFRDARLEDDPPYGSQRTQSRTCRYRMLGTAKDKHLFSTEYVSAMDFKTTIDGYHKDLNSFVEEDPPFAYCLLIAGIMNVDHLGGDKSTGSGEVRILIERIEYNGKPVLLETIFEYLDSDMYRETML